MENDHGAPSFTRMVASYSQLGACDAPARCAWNLLAVWPAAKAFLPMLSAARPDRRLLPLAVIGAAFVIVAILRAAPLAKEQLTQDELDALPLKYSFLAPLLTKELLAAVNTPRSWRVVDGMYNDFWPKFYGITNCTVCTGTLAADEKTLAREGYALAKMPITEFDDTHDATMSCLDLLRSTSRYARIAWRPPPPRIAARGMHTSRCHPSNVTHMQMT